MTIDVEDYFHVSAFAAHIPRSEWDRLPCRVERNLEIILDLLQAHHARATFFTLGWVAERYPGAIRKIHEAGHEVASHGFSHKRANEQSRKHFLQDVETAKKLLEDTTGTVVRGYRAPSFSINASNIWALDCLAEAGYVYSSSVYPIRHDHYGMPEAPRFPHRVGDSSRMLEIPVTTVRLLNHNLPAGGGGYFRLLPYALSKWSLRRVNETEDRPCVFYFHPWELDPDQPRQIGIDLRTRFRHYLNLSRMRGRLDRLLRDFRWDRMDRVFLPEAP